MRFVLCAALLASPAAAQDVTGIWRTEKTGNGYLEVQIAPCAGGKICGTILRARDLADVEQDYPHIGRQMVWDMVPNGENQWADGRIWDPRDDRTFRSRMILQGDTLAVSGCFLGICQGQNWQRAQ